MLFLAALLLASCAPGGFEGRQRELTIAAFAPLRPALARIVPRFEAEWERAHPGQDLRIVESYASSGAQSRAVADGLEADVVLLGLAPDVERLVRAGLVSPDWRSRVPNNGIVARSLIVFLVRRGNPQSIADWPDLARPGVRVVQASPRSSGGARWVSMAAYGAGGEPALRALFAATTVFDKDARDAAHTFVRKRLGTVLPTWECEARLVLEGGAPVELVTPRRSILAEVPACVVDAYADRRGTRDVAEALLAFLFSAEAQEMLAASGLRPVSPEVGSRLASAFPLPAGGAFTVADLGGWEQVDRLLFAPGAVVDDLQNVGRDASVSRSREEALPAGVPPS